MQDKIRSPLWATPIRDDGTPKYLAIAQALIADIQSGRLAPGARLPAQRDLARDLNVDLTTVTRAINEVRRHGLVEGHTKRGSFVRMPVRERYASPADPMGIVDLSMNMPPQPTSALLRERIRDGLEALLASPFGLLQLQYHSSMGVTADRLAGVQFLHDRIGAIGLDRLVVTSGAQAALSGILAAILPRGATVACAAVTYPGLRAIAERQGQTLIGLAQDGQGIIPAAFEAVCAAHRPQALYLVPHIDNPTTATLPLSRREEIIGIARRHAVVLIEDDAYGALPLDPIAPFAALAPDISWHIATLAKCATPALRVAYAVAPDVDNALRLAADIRATQLMAPPLMTGLATRWIQDGTLAALTEAVRSESAARQELAARALRGFEFDAHPQGHHLWLHLPADWRTRDLAYEARQAGLSVVTSEAFAVGAPPNALRISLGASASRDALERGLTILAQVLAGAVRPVPAIV